MGDYLVSKDPANRLKNKAPDGKKPDVVKSSTEVLLSKCPWKEYKNKYNAEKVGWEMLRTRMVIKGITTGLLPKQGHWRVSEQGAQGASGDQGQNDSRSQGKGKPPN
jgi:hypothetical protein